MTRTRCHRHGDTSDPACRAGWEPRGCRAPPRWDGCPPIRWRSAPQGTRRGGHARTSSPRFWGQRSHPAHAKGCETPAGPWRVTHERLENWDKEEVAAVTQSSLPSRHCWFWGARASRASWDAQRTQLSTRQSFMGFFKDFCALQSVFQHDRGNEFLLYHNCSISADKDLSVITPSEGFHKPGALKGFWFQAEEGFFRIKKALIQGKARQGALLPPSPEPLGWCGSASTGRVSPHPSELPGSTTAGGR